MAHWCHDYTYFQSFYCRSAHRSHTWAAALQIISGWAMSNVSQLLQALLLQEFFFLIFILVSSLAHLQTGFSFHPISTSIIL